MKYKICRSILLTLMSLIIIISTMGLVSGAELQIVEDSLSSNLLVPQNLYSFLESVFIQIGKAEHEFQNVDISGFFENPVSNSSYQFFNRRIQYYQSFRTKYFDPVVNLNQSIEVIDYCQKENGLLSLTVKHRVSFSYAHMPSDSRQTLTYFIELIPNANSYLIRNMESNDFADSVYRNDIVSMERETASYNALPVNKAVLVDESQTDQTGLLSDVSLRGTVSGNNILMNRSNAVNYSYIYANDPRYATSSEFNPLFGYLSADCMNFVSQCIWAGLGGSDSTAGVSNGWLPMDKEGSYRWYRDSSGNSASWQGTLSFNTYINNMINAGSNESGLNATVFDLGTGADFSSIPSSVRVGSIVLGSMPSPSHAVLIVQVNGTDRSNVLYNGHNGNEQEYSIRYQYGDAPLRIISVGSYKVGTTCNHTYSNVPSGGGTDATCNNPGCNFSRIYIDPNILKPVSANTVQTISAYFGYNVYTASYKIYSLNSNGTRNSLLYTSSEVHSTNSISGTYRFTQAGLYEIEFTVEDCSTEENIITNSMRIRVR